ncbi:MAG TPA: hypothetical protein DIT64_02580 [Verrucomicrobiales bacterium]|nr:hypothetical protein [Verrucomicrobiales bacterium]
MRLEDLTLVLRPRSSWEAADLGCALVRRDYGRILALWAVTVLPVWALLAALLWRWPVAFSLVVWWLKPLYDRVPLHHLARAAFGGKPTLGETLRAWPGLWTRFLFSALLWRRFSLMRSFTLPVLMLEGQRGRAARARVSTLASDGGSGGAMLTWVFVHLEIAAAFGLMALTSTLGPAEGLPDFQEMLLNPEEALAGTHAQQWLGNLLYLVTITLIEPFYVGAGFGLYLNSRIKLEGWDIELAFRRLAARLRPVVTVLLLLFSCLVATAQAATPSGAEPVDKEAVKQKAAEVLARPEFEEHVFKQKTWVPELGGSSGEWDLSFLSQILGPLGYLLVGALVALLVWLVALLVWLVARNAGFFSIRRGARPPVRTPAAPRVLMGMEITPESLPPDIPAAARAAWREGRAREALSLLYRGSLSRLVTQHRLPIRDSDTEDDCLLLAARLGQEGVSTFFRQLTLLWVRAAYAGREARVEEFEHLCAGWPFEKNSPSTARRTPFAPAALLCLLLTACSGKWEDVEIELGHKGKARLDPFLAAQHLLQDLGHEAARQPALKLPPDASGAMLILSAEGGMPEGRARQLLQWTREGGHLVYALAGCAPYNDWGGSGGGLGLALADHSDDPLLRALGVKATGGVKVGSLVEDLKNLRKDAKQPEKSGNESAEKKGAAAAGEENLLADNDELEAPGAETGEKKKNLVIDLGDMEDMPLKTRAYRQAGQEFEFEMPAVHHFTIKRRLAEGEHAAGTRKEAAALSLRHGQGRVTLLAHARPFRNRYLDEHEHAAWLAALAGNEPRRVWFIVSLNSGFFELLWSRAWRPLTALGLLVLAWLWMSLPRFGPARAAALHQTRHFADHLAALGQFFHRLRRDDLLLAAAQDAVRVRVLRARPHLAGDDEAQLAWLAAHSGMALEQIRALMTPPEARARVSSLARRMQDLQTLARA